MSRNPPDLDRLIERCRNADERAWVQLMEQFADQVERWLARLDYVLREPDLEDLRNEVFIKVCRTLPMYRAEDSPFRVWLYQQTYSIAIDNWRRRNAGKRIPPNVIVSIDDEPDDSGTAVNPPATGVLPNEAAAQNDMHRLLFVALDALGPPECRCRQLIGFVYFGGFTYHEVGEVLQMKAKTVGSALTRCLADLREIWAKLFPGAAPPPSANG